MPLLETLPRLRMAMFRILLKHPQLAEYCDFSKLKSRELCLLHHDFPEMRFEHIGDK